MTAPIMTSRISPLEIPPPAPSAQVAKAPQRDEGRFNVALRLARADAASAADNATPKAAQDAPSPAAATRATDNETSRPEKTASNGAAGAVADRPGLLPSVARFPRLGVEALAAVEVRGDLEPRSPHRPPLSNPSPSPDASILGELRLGIRADIGKALTARTYIKAASKGALSEQRAEYLTTGFGATLAARLTTRTKVTVGYERLSLSGPPAPWGPTDFRVNDVSLSVARSLTSKPAAPGRPSIEVTAAFVDRHASRPEQNNHSKRLTVDMKMPLAARGPLLVGSYQLRRDDYGAGTGKGRGDWFPVIASAGVKVPLGKSSCSATLFGEGRVQRSNRPGRDYANFGGGVRIECSR